MAIPQEVKNQLLKVSDLLPLSEREPYLLLGDNIPKPLQGMAPRTLLGDSWWNKTRKEAFNATNYHCLACGVASIRAKARRWLEGHEVYDIDYEKGISVYKRTVPLCHFCHNYIHDGRLLGLLKEGLIHQGKYISIIQHGDRVLASVGLKRLSHQQRHEEGVKLSEKGKMCPWSKWKLIVFGVEYKTPFKNYEAWRVFHDAKNKAYALEAKNASQNKIAPSSQKSKKSKKKNTKGF